MNESSTVEIDLKAELERILLAIRQDTFGGRAAPTVRMQENTSVDADGALQGGIEVFILKRNGEEAKLHEQSLNGVTSLDALKDAFGEALSIVLAGHTSWPR
ncbi:MAG: hypothetical protein JKY20_13160 [Alphaproteobacteria bacterium]|nr:hypothetical protein [Alphaproteobacteria bacterium]